jgi:23S rRNA (pseudouridine1915-N3)-methyltransferase
VKIRVLAVGKPRDAEAIALHDRYAERIRKLGVTYETDSVPEVKAGGRYSDEHVRQREGRLLADKLGDRGTTIALDRQGRSFSSETLSKRLQGWSTPIAEFVIGGPLGLGQEFCERADLLWSLSELTLPHELARVVLAEQLYRALTLLRGIPYHK